MNICKKNRRIYEIFKPAGKIIKCINFDHHAKKRTIQAGNILVY